MAKLQYETIFFPGRYMSDEALSSLTNDLKSVAKSCFDTIPSYQALTGRREEYERAVITIARNRKGEALGFVSALVLKVDYVGDVLHLGLTCVHPKARGLKLTHKLASKMLMNYLIKEAPLGSTWISNCACVLSSLGNVALYFEDLYPSPYGVKAPSINHLKIAQDISEKYREPIAINKDAVLNTKSFIFEASVEGTVFEKDSSDRRFHHRDENLTAFYQDLINFERGDEVLQIGKVSLMTFPKYLLKQFSKKLKVPAKGQQLQQV